MKSTIFTYKEGKRKALTMSYDDGVIQDKRLIDIFNRYGIKGSFHLNGGLLGASEKLARITKEEIKEVYAGHEVSSHSFTHPLLDRLAHMDIVHEIFEDKKAVEEACGYIVRGMSYPFGTFNNEVVEVIQKLGMNYARTTVSTGWIGIPKDFLRWNPSCHHNDDRLMTILENLKATNQNLSLMYVWGHSYEFDDDDNWGMIEEFCEKAGGDSDIWYATNIEIFDYITAIRKCELSADRTMLYNPSAASVWVKVGENTIECKGGETTKLDL